MFLNQNNLEILRQVLDEYTKQTNGNITVPPELENYEFSQKFERFMQRLIRRQRKPYYNCIDTVAKRVACYVIIFITCMLFYNCDFFVTLFCAFSLSIFTSHNFTT